MDRALNDPVVDCCERDVADCDCPKYVATVNVPGYLPMDDDPPVFATAREAWSYLADERKRVEDDYPDWEGADAPLGEYSGTYGDLVSLGDGDYSQVPATDWPINADGTGTVYGDTPGYDGTHDLGLAYCVSVAE